MTYTTCSETEATHVRIADTEDNDLAAFTLCITIGEVYKIYRNNEKGFEGEEMIKTDRGRWLCSFSCGVDVEWLKELN